MTKSSTQTTAQTGPTEPTAPLASCLWCDDDCGGRCFEQRLAAARGEGSSDAAIEAALTAAEQRLSELEVELQTTKAKLVETQKHPVKPGLGERIATWWHGRPERRLERLQRAAFSAAGLREYQTHPAVVALEAEQRWRLVKRVLWAAIIGGLAFTMTNVHSFVVTADRVETFSPMWFAAWMLDPMVSLLFVALILAEEITERFNIPINGLWPRLAKWGAFTATYVMNTWSAWTAAFAAGVSGTTVAPIILHSIPPVVVLIAVEALPVIRQRMSEAIEAAAHASKTGSMPERKNKPRRRARKVVAESKKTVPEPKPAPVEIPAPDRMVDTGEFRAIEQGQWPTEAPVSPAPGEPTSAEQRPATGDINSKGERQRDRSKNSSSSKSESPAEIEDGGGGLVRVNGDLVAPLEIDGVPNAAAAGWIAWQLNEGEEQFGPAVARLFGVSKPTGRRWINCVAARPELVKREKEMLEQAS